MLRVEDKYIIPPADFYDMKERMNAIISKDQFSLASPEGYKISSIYFDDAFDSSYHETVAGNPIRHKYRIRIYNDSFETIKLEVKTKVYGRISKESCLITPDEYGKLMDGETIEWGKNRDNPRSRFNEAICQKGLRPKVIVTYEREAFLYQAGNTRITFDKNVRASEIMSDFGCCDAYMDHLEDDHVLEVKYDEFIPGFVLQALEQNSMWKTSFSKYRSARERYQ